jgi:hypothetical protein
MRVNKGDGRTHTVLYMSYSQAIMGGIRLETRLQNS